MFQTSQSLEQIVTANPRTAEWFIRHRLDFCCRGQRSLAEACDEAGLDADRSAEELARIEAAASLVEDWERRPLGELIDHILDRYHEPLRRELGALVALARRVEQVHADKPSRPVGLAAHLERVRDAVENHLAKEERILFPIIRERRGGTAHMPIKVLMYEHSDHGDDLRRTRALTSDLTPPAEACTSWRALYAGLAALEAQLFRHIHLENYVLFPRALHSGADAEPS